MGSSFKFKQFSVKNECSAMKVGTDGVLLGAWVSLSGKEKTILDVGTGTGVIALMLAQRCGSALITALDIDEPSVEEAAGNFADSPWNGRLKAIKGDFRSFENENQYDLIVSNPPYFINSLKAPQERRNAARHNDTLSHNDLIKGASRLLKEGGRLAVVLPSDEGDLFAGTAFESGLFLKRICRVRTKSGSLPKRCLMEFSAEKKEPLVEEELIMQSGAEFTPDYVSLTRDFYLAF